VNVSCYAGARYPERPRAFLWQGRWLAVRAVESRWRTPQGPIFRVRTGDNRRFTLAYQEVADLWTIRQITIPSTERQRGKQ